MKQSKILSGLILAVALTSVSTLSMAGPNHRHHDERVLHERSSDQARWMSVKRAMHALSHLDLTEQQKIDIKALVKEGIEASKAKRVEVKKLHKKLKQANKDDVIDEQAIRSTSSDIADLKSDLLIMHLNKRKQVMELLTDEQKAKMKEVKAKKNHRRKD